MTKPNLPTFDDYISFKANMTVELSQPVNLKERRNRSDKARISPDRQRTNILSVIEQPVLVYLCRIMPKWINSDALTFIGLLGSVIVTFGFWLASSRSIFLLVCIMGFAIQWFGDSLDGRIAYYRNIPRRWYGFVLDFCMDWISIVLIGIGFYIFLGERYQILAFTFVTAYGWSMMLALLKFKIANLYAIDMGGSFGPTEFRLAICAALFTGIFFPSALIYLAILINLIVYAVNIVEFIRILKLANRKDLGAKKQIS